MKGLHHLAPSGRSILDSSCTLHAHLWAKSDVLAELQSQPCGKCDGRWGNWVSGWRWLRWLKGHISFTFLMEMEGTKIHWTRFPGSRKPNYTCLARTSLDRFHGKSTRSWAVKFSEGCWGAGLEVENWQLQWIPMVLLLAFDGCETPAIMKWLRELGLGRDVDFPIPDSLLEMDAMMELETGKTKANR